MDWTNNNRMKCNTAKCKELVIRKKCNNSIYPKMFNIKQYDRVTLLGLTYCRFDQNAQGSNERAFNTTVSASDKISYMNKLTHVMAWNYGGKVQTSQ